MKSSSGRGGRRGGGRVAAKPMMLWRK
jgi:hypothetical protein